VPLKTLTTEDTGEHGGKFAFLCASLCPPWLVFWDLRDFVERSRHCYSRTVPFGEKKSQKLIASHLNCRILCAAN
jgi:hypothetical protein